MRSHLSGRPNANNKNYKTFRGNKNKNAGRQETKKNGRLNDGRK